MKSGYARTKGSVLDAPQELHAFHLIKPTAELLGDAQLSIWHVV